MTKSRLAISSYFNTICYRKGCERYVLQYRDGQESEALLAAIRWVDNKSLSFDAWDYADVERRVLTDL